MRDFWPAAHPWLRRVWPLACRVLRSVRRRRPPTDGIGEPDHRARRLHTGGSGVVRAQAQRGERRIESRWRLKTTARGTAASKVRPMTASILALTSRASSGRCSPHCCCHSACPCCSAATSSGVHSMATTTRTVRTTLSTGSTGRTPIPALLDFARRAIAVRRRHPVLRRRRYLTGAEAGEIEWFTPAGAPMTGPDWDDPNAALPDGVPRRLRRSGSRRGREPPAGRRPAAARQRLVRIRSTSSSPPRGPTHRGPSSSTARSRHLPIRQARRRPKARWSRFPATR